MRLKESIHDVLLRVMPIYLLDDGFHPSFLTVSDNLPLNEHGARLLSGAHHSSTLFSGPAGGLGCLGGEGGG